MDDYDLMPNEIVILKEDNVARGRTGLYVNELILTNINVVFIQKSFWLKKTKNIIVYPLNQIKIFNDKPQVMKGKLPNGQQALELYFLSGSDSFSFSSGNKKKINQWVDAITKVVNGNTADIVDSSNNEDYDPDTLIGAFKEVGDEFKDAGQELLDSIGFKPKKRESKPVKVTKKCIGCSAPLTGYKGETVKCKYCNTTQVL